MHAPTFHLLNSWRAYHSPAFSLFKIPIRR